MKILCNEVLLNSDNVNIETEELAKMEELEPMCERYEHPDLEEAIAHVANVQHCKRFNT